MKKQLIYSGVIAASAIGIFAGAVAMNNASAETIDTAEPLTSIAANLTNAGTISIDKDETVYVIADNAGAAQKTFIGSTLNTGSEKLPFEMHIRYYLNGTEVPASEIAGKSGHAKIVFSYDSTASYQGKQIPFLAVSGTMLDQDKFTNITLTNGKLLDDGSRLTVVGYSLVGVNQDLGTDFLPDEFAIEADVKDFELPVSYSLFTNEIFSEIDTAKLSNVDSLVNSVNELAAGLDQIISGADSLSSGLNTTLDGTKALYAGSQQLSAGLTELESHNSELISGAEQIANMAPTIASLMQDKKADLESQKSDLESQLAQIPVVDATAEIRAQISAGIAQIDAGIAQLDAGLAKLPELSSLYDGIVNYTNGVTSAASGAAELSAGIGSLVDGTTELYNGSVTLLDGLNTFKTSGINKLVDFANNDIQTFTYNARATVAASQSYHSFKNPNATSVKFIVKTASVKSN